ncbi:hypothetical protein ACVILE_003478 [Streptomyces sp. M18.1]
MKNFLVKTIANAAALAVAVWLLDKITLTGGSTGEKTLTLIVVALVFGLVNMLVKPIVQVLTFPLFILTLGLFTPRGQRADAVAHLVAGRQARPELPRRRVLDRRPRRTDRLGRLLGP